MDSLFNMSMPFIPPGLLHTMYELKTKGNVDQNAGGQFKPSTAKKTAFEGVVLPVSDKDLRRAPEGTYTALSEKIYTNGHTLQVGAQVLDPPTGITYTVTQELGHNSIHPMKRYVVEAKGRSAAKK